MEQISDFVRRSRKAQRLTQPELAARAGVGLRFLRELERGKQSLRMDKLNQVLSYFGASCGVDTEHSSDRDSRSYRLSSTFEPSENMLREVMHGVGESARASDERAQEVLRQMMQHVRDEAASNNKVDCSQLKNQ